jgi:DNA repair photolyase
MPRPVKNPPNPWASGHVEWLEEPPLAALELYEEEAKSIINENDSPDIGFQYSINPYRGCFHSCAYCLGGDTPILLGDGTTRPIRDLKVDDEIYGTVLRGKYRYYTKTKVLAHWQTLKPAYRITLEDGTAITASGDHRFLSERGWKYVTNADGRIQRAHLTTNNSLIGTGAFAAPPRESAEYRRGYLCGLIRGDGHLATYVYQREGRAHGNQYQFRLALADLEALRRAKRYLSGLAVGTHDFVFVEAVAGRKEMQAIRTSARESVERISELIAWPADPTSDWSKGFLAGIFDAEGSCSGVIRICNTAPAIIERTADCLRRFGFEYVVEALPREKPIYNVRLRGGLRERLRFFHTVGTAISRKRDIGGAALKSDAKLGVAAIEPLNLYLPMFDITTGTGDFIANGVVSHNCYARPSHQYLGFGAGTDFDRKIVVKTNAPELLRAELSRPSWKGETITFSGNTDCYQPIEASYELTRRCLEICLEFKNPISIITKGTLVRRDVELLAALAREARASVHISLAFADSETCRLVEPSTSTPAARLETIRILSEAGVPVGLALAPLIPGLNDSDIPELLRRAKEAGARHAFTGLVRLPREVLTVFQERISEAFPERAQKIFSSIEETRGGRMNDAAFGARMRGRGVRWEMITKLFELSCKRLGLNEAPLVPEGPSPFRRPSRQLSLFEV